MTKEMNKKADKKAENKKVEDTATKRLREYLEGRAKRDKAFAEMYSNPDKTLEKCVQYIKECAHKKAKNGSAFIDDDEVYGWAIHYYNEADVQPKNNISAVMGTSSKPAKIVKKVAEKIKEESGSCDPDELLEQLENI